jgi:vacuolar-type H+-ATPase subunit I/STV1
MKFIIKGIVMSVLIGLTAVSVQAQKVSKAEKKALKKEAKAMYKDVTKLKALKDSKKEADSVLTETKKEILKLKATQHDFEQRESVMLSTIDSLSARLKRAKDKIKELENSKPVATATPTNTGVVQGVVFKVQVGAYKNKSFDHNNNTDYTKENADGYNKHVLGSFSQYQEAKSFAEHLVQLGIKGAWVVAFKDGVRISVKEALGGSTSTGDDNAGGK